LVVRLTQGIAEQGTFNFANFNQEFQVRGSCPYVCTNYDFDYVFSTLNWIQYDINFVLYAL